MCGSRDAIRAVHDAARAADPDIPPVSDTAIVALTGGISRAATIEILAGRAKGLPDLAGDLVEFALRVGDLPR